MSNQSRPAGREGIFGGRVLLAVGAFILLLGLGFFITFAFDSGWEGAAGRIAIGLVGGVTILLGGERFDATRRSLFARSMTGLGAAILYASLWAADALYQLIPLPVSFSTMAFVTAALIVLAWRHDSELIAAFAIAGGFATPLLNVSDHLSLYLYLALLNGALAFLPIAARWPRIQFLSFFLTQLFFLGSLAWQNALPPATALLFATIYAAFFLVQPVRNVLRATALGDYEIGLVVMATAAYYYAIYAELFAVYRFWLIGPALALVALDLAIAWYPRHAMRQRSAR